MHKYCKLHIIFVFCSLFSNCILLLSCIGPCNVTCPREIEQSQQFYGFLQLWYAYEMKKSDNSTIGWYRCCSLWPIRFNNKNRPFRLNSPYPIYANPMAAYFISWTVFLSLEMKQKMNKMSTLIQFIQYSIMSWIEYRTRLHAVYFIAKLIVRIMI